LTDKQLIAYLERCKDGIRKEGPVDPAGPAADGCWLVVKENMSTIIYGDDIYDHIYDPEDSSVTRSDANFRKNFEKAGLKLITTQEQKGFPKDPYPVRMYALKPE
jgi:protein N-terminal methyltransferase